MFEDRYPEGTRTLENQALSIHWPCGAWELMLADRRDAALMLRDERLRCAGATPKQRVEWAEYVAAFGRNGCALVIA